ncbi:hypothetical protein ACJRO7_032724 [Eucalyptus globulus]|uniref:VQ domain-containing protein n=1 Tax=Eucalyptus globulus TaxID=34317 RepID=A0ABD3JUL8_EUCGL
MGKLNFHQIAKSQKPTIMARKKPLKIRYISSPVMVKASNASEFRAIVQELTGKDSNAGGFSECSMDGSRSLGQSNLQSQKNGEQDYVSYSVPFNGLLDEGLSWKECSEGLLGYYSQCLFV